MSKIRLTLKGLAELIADSERKLRETWISIMENPIDVEAAHRAYAEKWGHPPLTDMEKRQAIINHVLDTRPEKL